MPVLLIAGGSRGIGAATARLAAGQGYDVAVNYKTQCEAAAQVVEAVKAAGRKAVALKGDMGREADIERVFDATRRRSARSRILCIHPGIIGPLSRLDEVDAETMREVLDVNTLGAHALPARRHPPHVDQARRQRRRGGDAVVDGGDHRRRRRMRLVCGGQGRHRLAGRSAPPARWPKKACASTPSRPA